jgi:hypothetical protein
LIARVVLRLDDDPAKRHAPSKEFPALACFRMPIRPRQPVIVRHFRVVEFREDIQQVRAPASLHRAISFPRPPININTHQGENRLSR